ncbi:uncharacterized protein LOC123322913 [Coccinella septempunctata]|uniref:uncharacterized protein LOC123319201 n=1 Tax=Coccinella septempunctata TaxID=41139 RepID=UPI001D091F86|nr:uncharacterized protein LOC123319201 [Coccinella septempunctata]XP_044766929.1 uncharacterized protein LOC123322913 [Coccinella septempunctata]
MASSKKELLKDQLKDQLTDPLKDSTASDQRKEGSSDHLMPSQDEASSIDPPKEGPRTRSRSRLVTPGLMIKMATQLNRLKIMKDISAGLVDEPSEWTTSKLESLQERLDEQHKGFLKTHAHFESAWPESQIEHPYFSNDVFVEEEFLYASSSSRIRHLKEELEPPQPSSQPSSQPTASSTSAQPRLPDIPLPVFSGDYSSWPGFKDLFQSLVIQNTSISDVERLHYLRSSLQSTPLKLISGLALTGASFPIAWDSLLSQYENKRLLLAALCDKIFSTPHCSPQKNPRLYYKTLLTNLVEALQGLTALGQSLDSCDFLLVYVITKHLDRSTREKWESQLGSSTESPPLTKLMDFLQAHTRSLEWLEEPEDSSKTPASRPKTSYSHAAASTATSSKVSSSKVCSKPVSGVVPPRVVAKTAAKSPQRPVRPNGLPSYNCDDCGDEHFIATCPRYHSRHPSERHEVVHRRQLCYNCLGRHNVRSCRSHQTCRLCSDRHHSSLHDHIIMVSSARTPQASSARTPQASSSRPTSKPSEAKPATSKRA